MNPLSKRPVDAFSFMDYLVRFSQGVTNFRIPGLDNEIHFSISHHPNSDNFNFHVTRNTPDKENKPKVIICEIAKDDLYFWLKIAADQLFTLLYEQLPPQYLRKAKYIAFDDMKWLGKESAEVMNSVGHYKKRKLKLPDTLFGSIEDHLKEPSFQYRLEQAVQPFPNLPVRGCQAGVFWKGSELFPVLLTPIGCYRQREDLPLDVLLKLLPDQKLARRIYLKTALAIKLVATAKTRQELVGKVKPVDISRTIRELSGITM
jgi:hypothetical protein